MNHFDLAIAYRIYPRVAKPALGLPFSTDKLLLSEICLRSLKKSLGNMRVKIWVLIDGCPDAYSDLFRNYFAEENLVLVQLNGIGNLATFEAQIQVLIDQNASDFVYFAEDDYLYLPDQFRHMVEFLQCHSDVHFVTPYDHLDCYRLQIHQHPKHLKLHGGCHWRTAASTCLTFLTRKETLRRTKSVFTSYCRRNSDCSLWLSLTKRAVFDPFQFCRLCACDPHLAKTVAKAWLYNWPQIVFGKKMNLWAPIPAIATHLDRNAMAPGVDWLQLMESLAGSIGLQTSREDANFNRHVARTARG